MYHQVCLCVLLDGQLVLLAASAGRCETVVLVCVCLAVPFHALHCRCMDTPVEGLSLLTWLSASVN